MPRPQHRTVHKPCPNGKTNWADCDAAVAHQFGKCIAFVGDKTPEPCSRWAFDAKGYCGQHYISMTEAARKAERIAIAQQELSYRIDAYIAYTAEHPSIWDSPRPPRGVAPGLGAAPSTVVLETTAPTEAPRQRRRPHRLTSLD